MSSLSQEQINKLLMKNWMTHDALWYLEAAANFGMEAASPMNLRCCRRLGSIECNRLLKEIDQPKPTDLNQYKELFNTIQEVFVPDFMEMEISYKEPNLHNIEVKKCFAYEGMMKVGLIDQYHCGIFERILGWFDALGIECKGSPAGEKCWMREKGKCWVKLELTL